MKNLLAFASLAIFLFSPCACFAKAPIRVVEGMVTKVSDGDTLTVVSAEGTKIKVRLYGVDAPETPKGNRKTGRISKPGQPFGEEAFMALKSKVDRKPVKLEIVDVDRYKRSVCIVWQGSRSINREMVREGFAWAYREYLHRPYASEFIGMEEQARTARLGLWRQYNPQPPWEFRRNLKRVRG